MAMGAAGYGGFRASDADRERVIDTLKTAFVQGRLSQDEFGLRADQALVSRTYAELAAVTAGIPAVLTEARPVRLQARKPVSKKVVAWSACGVVSPPALWAAFLTFYGGFFVLLLLAFLGLVVSSAPWPPEHGARNGHAGGTRRR